MRERGERERRERERERETPVIQHNNTGINKLTSAKSDVGLRSSRRLQGYRRRKSR